MKNFFAAIGFVTFVAVGGVVGWRYRDQVIGFYRSVRAGDERPGVPGVVPGPDRGGTQAPLPADPGVATSPPPSRRTARDGEQGSPAPTGSPSEAALRSAQRKQQSMERPGGPALVTLSAAEMASLVQDGLGPAGREALDSLEVALAPGRLELRAALVTASLGGVLGPFAAMLDDREPMRASGPARVAAPGVVAWQPDSFVVRAFPFPQGFIPPMVDRLTGGRDGVVPIRVPSTVGDIRITPRGVTFYRREGP